MDEGTLFFLENLTETQQFICAVLWNLEEFEQVEQFKAFLPKELQAEVDICRDMITAAALDCVTNIEEPVRNLLRSFE